MRFTDTALLDAAGKLSGSGNQEETMTSGTICRELENTADLFSGVSPHTLDMSLWCISETSLPTLTPAYSVTSGCSLPFSFPSLIESGLL